MTRKAREWRRLHASYDMWTQNRLAMYEGRKTLPDRISYRITRLRFHFLPHYGAVVPKWRLKLRAVGSTRTLPDFACLGALKSGTTDLATYLFQHPCILPPLSKEIGLVNPEAWRPYYPTVREKEKVAQEHGKALSGYFTPWLHNLLLIDSYHAARPDAKIVIMLRNPIARAYSHYNWDRLIGAKRLSQTPYYRTFADYVDFALDLFPAMSPPSVCGHPLLQSGIYVKSVQRWIDRFGSENVYILRSEDFFKDVCSTLCGIHEFLGINPLKPELHEIVNQNPVKSPPMDEETRRKLQVFYRSWNDRLYTLIDRDLEWG